MDMSRQKYPTYNQRAIVGGSSKYKYYPIGIALGWSVFGFDGGVNSGHMQAAGSFVW